MTLACVKMTKSTSTDILGETETVPNTLPTAYSTIKLITAVPTPTPRPSEHCIPGLGTVSPHQLFGNREHELRWKEVGAGRVLGIAMTKGC